MAKQRLLTEAIANEVFVNKADTTDYASKTDIPITSKIYACPGNTTLTIPADEMPKQGAIMVVFGALTGAQLLSLYREGTFNRVITSTPNGNFAVGEVTDPGGPEQRMWIQSQAANAPLQWHNANGDTRYCRIYVFPI